MLLWRVRYRMWMGLRRRRRKKRVSCAGRGGKGGEGNRSGLKRDCDDLEHDCKWLQSTLYCRYSDGVQDTCPSTYQQS